MSAFALGANWPPSYRRALLLGTSLCALNLLQAAPALATCATGDGQVTSPGTCTTPQVLTAPTGVVVSGATLTTGPATAYTVSATDPGATVNNGGTITTTVNDSVVFFGQGGTLNNNGTIANTDPTSVSGAGRAFSTGNAVSLAAFTNNSTGMITSAANSAVSLFGPVTGNFQNSGTITGGQNLIAVFSNSNFGGSIINSGTLNGSFFATGSNVAGDINNSGTQNGLGGSFTVANIGGNFINTGSIEGQVGVGNFSAGNGNIGGSFRNSGTMTGGTTVGGTIGGDFVNSSSGVINQAVFLGVGVPAGPFNLPPVVGITGNFNNAGTIGTSVSISGATIAVGGDVLNSGTIQSGFGLGIGLSGGSHTGPGNTFVPATAVRGNVINSGSISMALGDGINIAGDVGGNIVNSGTISSSGGFLFASTLITAGVAIDSNVNYEGFGNPATFGSPIVGGAVRGNIVNTGSLSGTVGLAVTGVGGSIQNTASITGNGESAIFLLGNVAGGIVNTSTGTIHGGALPAGNPSSPDLGNGNAILVRAAQTGVLSNAGTISSDVAAAIVLNPFMSLGASLNLANTGTIAGLTGTALDYRLGTLASTINQMGGSIQGDILLSAVGDIVNVSGGTIAGAINGNSATNGANAGTVNFNLPAGSVFTTQGNINVANLNLNSGALVLRNDVTVFNAFTNNATLQLNDVAVRTITGNYVQGQGASIAMTITPSTSAQLFVNGVANIAGNVQINAQPGTYSANMRYTLLTATGGVNGTFSTLTTNMAFLRPVLSYDRNDVYLTVLPTNPTPAGTPDYRVAAQTYNQLRVATGLTFAGAQMPGGTGGLIIGALNTLTSAQAPAVFDALSGAGIGAAQNVAFDSSRLFTSAINDQGRYWREGGPDVNGITIGGAPAFYASVKKGPFEVVPPPPQPPPRTWRAWLTGFGLGETVHGELPLGTARQDNSLYGGAGGLDYQLFPNTLVGIAAGGSSGHFNVPSLATSGTVDGGHIGVYGVTRIGPFYAQSSTTFSAFNNHTSRTIIPFGGLPGERDRGDFASQQVRSRLEIGDKFIWWDAAVTPFVAMEIAKLYSSGFTETGGILGLTVPSRSHVSVPAFVGARFEKSFLMANGWVFTPAISAAWVHEFSPVRDLAAGLSLLPASAFVVDGARPASNAAQFKGGGKLALNGWVSVYADVEGEFSNKSQTYAGKGGVKVSW